MIFAKPSGAQTKTTYRSFEKSTKIRLMEEKKSHGGKKNRKRKMVMKHRF